MEKKLYICTFVFLKETLFYETGMSGKRDSTPEGKQKHLPNRVPLQDVSGKQV